MSKTITDLRAQLFTTLEGLNAGTMDVEKARAVSDIAQVIINSAKVEVDFIRATGGAGDSAFISGGGKSLPTGVTQHRLRG